jgi:selenide,water dikinase
VATAIKRGLCPPDLEQEAIRLMTTLNRQASEAMLEAGVTAATDVTGYGLIGHLANIEGGADIDFSAVPFMSGVHELAKRDLFPDGSRRNHQAYRDYVEWGGLGEMEQLMVCDAQTSGGLLVVLPPENAKRFESALADASHKAARIGVINGGETIRVTRS